MAAAAFGYSLWKLLRPRCVRLCLQVASSHVDMPSIQHATHHDERSTALSNGSYHAS